MSVSIQKASNAVRDFLGEFALAVHRYLIYPAGHPLLEENASKVVQVLGPAAPESQTLEITVAGNRLLVASDPDGEGPRHTELAVKLRDMGIGGIGIEASAELSDIQALLGFLSERSKAGLATLEPDTQVPGTTRIEIRPISLAGLHISWDDEENSGDRLSQLWIALDGAVGTLGDGAPFIPGGGSQGRNSGTPGSGKGLQGQYDPEAETDEDAIARLAGGMRRSTKTESGCTLAVGYLRQVLSEVGTTPKNRHAAMVRRRLSGLMGALDPDTIRKLAGAAGKTSDQASFVADLGILGDEAVAKVLKAVANPSARSLTESLGRLFGKMARQSSTGSGRIAEETQRGLRRSLLALLKEWALDDPNPTEYGAALERISQTLSGLDADLDLVGGREPERIVQMSIELSTFGPLTERASEHLLLHSEDGLTTLVGLIEGGDKKNPAIRELSRILYEPDRILALTDAEDVDEATLRSLTEHIGEPSIDPLLEVLADAESRTVRRKVFDCLVGFGAVAAEAALRRLPDDRWYVVRNLLALARKAGFHFAWFDTGPFLTFPDRAVRREAYLLAYLDPKRRTGALEAALAEDDDRILTGAFGEVESGVPSVIASLLASLILDTTLSESRRVSAIKAAGGSRAPVVLKALVETAMYRTRFLRRRKLRGESATVVTSVSVLRERWARNPEAKRVLALARRSNNAQIREAGGE